MAAATRCGSSGPSRRASPVRRAATCGTRTATPSSTSGRDTTLTCWATIRRWSPRRYPRALAEGWGLQTGFTDALQIEVAELLCRQTGAERVRFTTSGALATMYSILLARAHHRPRDRPEGRRGLARRAAVGAGGCPSRRRRRTLACGERRIARRADRAGGGHALQRCKPAGGRFPAAGRPDCLFHRRAVHGRRRVHLRAAGIPARRRARYATDTAQC